MLAAVYLVGPDSQYIINVCLILLAVSFLIYINPFIPLKLRRQMFFTAASRLELVPPNDPLLLPDPHAHINATIESLRPLGFEQRGLYKMVDLIPTAYAIIAVLSHAPSNTVATVTAIILKNVSNRPHSLSVTFRQLLADGRIVELSNARMQMHLRPRSHCIISCMPSLQNPTTLFRTFLQFSEYVAPGIERSTRELLDPKAAIEEDNKNLMEHWASTGQFTFNADRTQLRYTIKGAYFTVWKNVAPLKGILARRVAAKERALIQKLSAMHPPPSRTPIS